MSNRPVGYASTQDIPFLQYCKSCGRKHVVVMRPCPTCGVYMTAQPKSDKVYDKCMSLDYKCDGCDAYDRR